MTAFRRRLSMFPLPKTLSTFASKRPTITSVTFVNRVSVACKVMASSTVSTTAQVQEQANTSAATFSSYNIQNSGINEGPGVNLTEQQKLLVGSVLDLFEGNPTLKHLSLWSKDAKFEDPLTNAAGYDKFAAQWYGLPALFHPIHIQRHKVTSGGNPIELELSNKYTVKGVKKDQLVDSIVKIHVDHDGKIEKVEDRWNDKLPEGPIAETFRKLNAVAVPALVKVPKNEEEDMKMKAEREKSG